AHPRRPHRPEADLHPPAAARRGARGLPHLRAEGRRLHQGRALSPRRAGDPSLTGGIMLSVQEIRGVDLDPSRRPGYRGYRPIGPWPNTRYPPDPQPGAPASIGTRRTPVFGTAAPPHGPSGAVRRLAYRYPDHLVRHW